MLKYKYQLDTKKLHEHYKKNFLTKPIKGEEPLTEIASGSASPPK